MKKFVFSALMLLSAMTASAQEYNYYYTEYCGDEALKAEAAEWLQKGEWRNGFTKADPDPTVNVVNFYQQVKNNPEDWKALFQWLQNHDLLTISGGRHPIEGTHMIVSVEDSQNDPLSKRGSESHNKHIDFQYVVKGSERFGLIDHWTSKPNCKYNGKKDVIHYNYDVDKTKFVDSDPGHFFIFFPSDWHIAKVATNQADQTIRVIVIKVDWKE